MSKESSRLNTLEACNLQLECRPDLGVTGCSNLGFTLGNFVSSLSLDFLIIKTGIMVLTSYSCFKDHIHLEK